ncbi:MAG: AEC family transporter [Clostridiales bacterium]|jgi:predicted permease|nr:AEC family transporter [Clostridiales bacterium]
MDFLTSLTSVGLLVALAIPGYILKKLKMLPENITSGLVTVLLYVAMPFLTIKSFAEKTFEPELLLNMGIAAALSLLLIAGVFFISKLCFIFPVSKGASGAPQAVAADGAGTAESVRKVCVTAGYLNNCAFMGIPMLKALFPGTASAEPIIYSAVFTVVFNILAWTLSVYSMTGDTRFISVKKAILNPPTVALAVALPVFFTGFVLPAPVLTAVGFLGELTTPLSMMVMGIRLAEIRLLDLFKSYRVYISVGVKLIVAPLVTFGFLSLINLIFPLNSVLFITLYIIMAMPSASTVIMFAERFGADRAAAVKCVLLSSLLSIVTIPVLMLMCNLI